MFVDIVSLKHVVSLCNIPVRFASNYDYTVELAFFVCVRGDIKLQSVVHLWGILSCMTAIFLDTDQLHSFQNKLKINL